MSTPRKRDHDRARRDSKFGYPDYPKLARATSAIADTAVRLFREFEHGHTRGNEHCPLSSPTSLVDAPVTVFSNTEPPRFPPFVSKTPQPPTASRSHFSPPADYSMHSLAIPGIPQPARTRPDPPRVLITTHTAVTSTTTRTRSPTDTIRTFCDSPPGLPTSANRQLARPPVSSRDVALRLYVSTPRPIDGYPPQQASGCTDVVMCTVLVAPIVPIRVGSRVTVISVQSDHDPAATVDDPTVTEQQREGDTFSLNNTLAIGSVTSILSIEKRVVTFVVHNTTLPESRIAFLHVSVEYRPGITVDLDVWTRLYRLILRRALPDTRILPLSQRYIISEPATLPVVPGRSLAKASDSSHSPAVSSTQTPTSSNYPASFMHPPQTPRLAAASTANLHGDHHQQPSPSTPTTPSLSPTTPLASASIDQLVFCHVESPSDDDRSSSSSRYPPSTSPSNTSSTPRPSYTIPRARYHVPPYNTDERHDPPFSRLREPPTLHYNARRDSVLTKDASDEGSATHYPNA